MFCHPTFVEEPLHLKKKYHLFMFKLIFF
uniref:Uncharacterized protein n=1 Tax=Arundo donax TaxID=35708 RepID=A0A0A9E782_ARUDO